MESATPERPSVTLDSRTLVAIVAVFAVAVAATLLWVFFLREDRMKALRRDTEERRARALPLFAAVRMTLSRAQDTWRSGNAEEATRLAGKVAPSLDEGLSLDGTSGEGLYLRAWAASLSGDDAVDLDAVLDRVAELAPALAEARALRARRMLQRLLARLAVIEASPLISPAEDDVLAAWRESILGDAAAARGLPASDAADLRVMEAFLLGQPLPQDEGPVAASLRAWERIDEGDGPGALAQAEAALARAPLFELPRWLRARARIATGNLPGAAFDLDALLATDASVAAWWLDLSVADPYRADAALEEALRRAPDEPAVLARQAEHRIATRRFEEAIVVLGRALARAPNAPRLFAARARVLARLGRAGAARADWDVARLHAPNLPDVLRERALFLARIGAFAEAVADADRARQIDSSPLSLAVFADALLARGTPEDALSLLDGEDPSVLSARSRVLRSLGRAEEARAAAERAGNAVEIALSDLALGRVAEAEERARRVSAACPDDSAALESLALALLSKGDLENAAAALDAAIAVDPLRVSSHVIRGEALFRLGRLQAALDAFAAATAINVYEPAAWRGQAQANLALGDPWRAREALDHAVLIEAKDPRNWILRSGARRRTDDLQGALEDLDQALAVRPDDPTCLAERARLYLARNEPSRARADVEKALALSPRCAAAWLVRGLLDLADGNLDEAEKDLARALEHDPFLREALVARAGLRQRRGDAVGARDDLDDALRADPNDPDALMARARLSMEQARWEPACADLERFLARHPDHPRTLDARNWLATVRSALKIR